MTAQAGACDAHLVATHAFFLGDLNYRAPTVAPRETLSNVAAAVRASARDAAARVVSEKRGPPPAGPALWRKAVENDELLRERTAGRVFSGWAEAPLRFPPTYRIAPHVDDVAHAYASYVSPRG